MKFQSKYLDEKYDIENLTLADLDDFYATYERNLTTMARVSKANGASIIFVTQPIGGLSDRESCNRMGSNPVVKRRYRQRYPQIAKSAEKVARAEGAAYVDGRELFAGRDCLDGFFANEVHLSSTGQGVVAEAVYPLVRAALWPPPTAAK